MRRPVIISLILLSVIFLNCSKEEMENLEALKVSPPNWIQGTWRLKDSASGNQGWKFTRDSAIQIDEDGFEISILATYFVLTGLTGAEVTVKESNSPGYYSINITTESSSSRYVFSRLSDREISWDNAPPLNGPEICLKVE